MSDSVSGRKHIIGAEKSRQTGGNVSSNMPVNKSSAEESLRYKSSKESSVYKCSEEYFEYICDPCNSAGDHAEAHGYCTDCKEYLCGTCFKSHSRSKLSKYHTLLDRDNMPKYSTMTCDPCKAVGDEEEAVGYCTDCNEYMCGGCFKSHSRSRLSRNHVLLDKENMPKKSNTDLACSVKETNTCGGGEKFTYIRDININTEGDDNDCFVTDIALVSKNKAIVCDRANNALKLVDTKKNVIESTLRLKSEPHGIAAMSHDQIALALGNECALCIITIPGGLTVKRWCKTDGFCVDVKYSKEKLFVSFWNPVKFQIFESTGLVCKTIKPEAEVLAHCTMPRYIALNPENSFIYVSDWETGKVMLIDLDGHMVYIYHGIFSYPHGIAVSPLGIIYLCNRNENNVYTLTPDLSDSTAILGLEDGVTGPQALCIDTLARQLYIGTAKLEAKYANYIKLFEWK